MNLLRGINSLEKEIRASVINKHLTKIGINKCVCFTCGNSAEQLRKQGLEVIGVGDNEILRPEKWFCYTEIQSTFNGLFDATSGHLAFPLMAEISDEFNGIARGADGRICYAWEKDNKFPSFEAGKTYGVPTGSGETIICLKMALPSVDFEPVRLKDFRPTKFLDNYPLNKMLYAMFGTYGKEIKVD